MRYEAVSVICPAYHDEANIGPLVLRCLDVLGPICGALEIIIVEDGSPDGTAAAADALAARHPEVTALHHEKNRGHGGAISTGLARAAHPLIAVMDGDGQYDPGDLPAMLDMLLAGADVVQGRRARYPNGPARAAMSWAYNAMARALFRSPARDLGCGIKALKRDALQSVAPPSTDGIFMQGELVIRMSLAGRRVEESTVSCAPRRSGRSSSISSANLKILYKDLKRFRKEISSAGRGSGKE